MVFTGDVITGPRPETPRVSLLSSAPRPDIGTARWQAGFAYRSRACGHSGTGVFCGAHAEDAKTIVVGDGVVEWYPYYVWAGDRCTASGATYEELLGRTVDLLDASTSHEVEYELWTGRRAQQEGWPNGWLASPAAVVVGNPAGVAPAFALPMLQEALAQTGTGGRGAIHAPHGTVSLWFNEYLGLRREGLVIYDPFDNVIIPGSGYPGTSPTGAVDGTGQTSWAYATDLVYVLLDEDTPVGDNVTQTLDRGKNTIETRAERLAAASWEQCRHFGVNVDRGAAFTDVPRRTA